MTEQDMTELFYDLGQLQLTLIDYHIQWGRSTQEGSLPLQPEEYAILWGIDPEHFKKEVEESESYGVNPYTVREDAARAWHSQHFPDDQYHSKIPAPAQLVRDYHKHWGETVQAGELPQSPGQFAADRGIDAEIFTNQVREPGTDDIDPYTEREMAARAWHIRNCSGAYYHSRIPNPRTPSVGGRATYDVDDKIKILEAFDRLGATQVDFAKAYGLSRHSIINWRRERAAGKFDVTTTNPFAQPIQEFSQLSPSQGRTQQSHGGQSSSIPPHLRSPATHSPARTRG